MTQTSGRTEIILEFLRNDANEGEGLGNAGIETYRDEPYAGTAREVGQNSRDASTELPVRISFDVIDVPFDKIPQLEKLRSSVEACLNKAEAASNEKEIAFFEQAQRVLKTGPLKVLHISDSNTTGLKGPDVEGTPFHSLVKGSGVSIKSSDTSGGSFGIGKNAVYAISDLQTVFYSTIYLEAGEPRFLAQGKSILVSHIDSSNTKRRAFGYWGLPDFQPIDTSDAAPEWLRRKELGTSVFAMGFRDTPDWQHRITYSLLQNFFYAIYNGEMEFAIDHGKIIISKLTLGSLFDDVDIASAAAKNDRLQAYELSKNLFQCLTSTESREDEFSIEGLGRIRIRVLASDRLPKKVCIIRNGMVITDSLELFGEKFARFPMYRDFVALVVPLDDEGRAFIKKLENPKHDGLSPERLPDQPRREHAKTVMKELAKKIRDTIRSYTLAQFEDEVSADEMRQYFPTDAAKPADSGESAQDDPETIRYQLEPKKPRSEPHAVRNEEGNVAGPRLGPTPSPGPGAGPGPSPGQGPRSRPNRGKGEARPIMLADVRNLLPRAENPKARTIMFTPSEGGMATILLEASGLNDSEDLRVMHATDASVSGGRITRRVEANERTRIDIEFDEPYLGPIELTASIEPEEVTADESE